MSSLFDENKVALEWISSKNITGIKVTDITKGKTIFLPVVGGRDYYNGTLLYIGSYGLYWNNSQNINNIEFYRKVFRDSDNMVLYYLGSKNAIYGFFLCCVAE